METTLLVKCLAVVRFLPYMVLLFSFMFYCGFLSDEDYHKGYVTQQRSDPPIRTSSVIREPHFDDVIALDTPNRIEVETEPASHFYDVTIEADGPILRDRQLVGQTSQETNKSRVIYWSDRRVQLGELITLGIEVDKQVPRDTIFNVLAIAKNHIMVGNPPKVFDFNFVINFTFTPRIPGVYDLFVEEVLQGTQLQLPGSPFHLVVEGDPVYAVEIGRRSDALPSCQTLRQTRPSWLGGEWMTSKLAGTKRGVLRSGWIFQPDWCSFDVFTTEDLALAAESSSLKTIAILGSSIERGIFYTLVDLILEKTEKRKLGKSDFAECWGYAQLQVGNLKFIYQDFRVENSHVMDIKNGKSEVICHNEKLAKKLNYDFFGEGMRFLKEYLFTETLSPDVVLIAVRHAQQMKLLLTAIPVSWSGTIYPLYNFKSRNPNLFSMDGLSKSYQIAMELLTLDSRIELIDGFALGSGMIHNTQSAPYMISIHWHRKCNELNGTMRVCGNPTEMIAQMLLGKVIAPYGKESWLKSVNSTKSIEFPRDISVCQDCPASLLPFHVKVIPDLSCYISSGIVQRSMDKHSVWDGTLCPEECMKTEPVGKEQTQSGPVNVRKCSVNLL